MKYTVLIPVKYSDYYLVKDVCDSLQNIYDINKIFIITNVSCVKDLIDIPNVVTIDEDKLYPGLSLDAVRNVMNSTQNLNSKYAGWCFQQFIKFAFCFTCDTAGYLVWDADTYPIRSLEYYDEDKDITTFHLINEHTQRYFDNLKNILGIEKQIDKSFISEHMYFDCSIVKEMLNIIESNDIKGDNWWEKMLFAMTQGNGLSEYEIYGNYMMKYYSNKCILVESRSLKYGISILGHELNDEKMEWIGSNFDCVSFEHWDHETFLTHLSDLKIIRSIRSKKLIQVLVFFNRAINYCRRKLKK